MAGPSAPRYVVDVVLPSLVPETWVVDHELRAVRPTRLATVADVGSGPPRRVALTVNDAVRVVDRLVRSTGSTRQEYACTSATFIAPPGEVAVGSVWKAESEAVATCRLKTIS